MNDEIGSSKSRRKLTASAKKVVNEIIEAAEESKAAQAPEGGAVLEEKIKESETKRLLLAEALHASQEKMRQIIRRGDDREDRALPFGVFVRPGSNGETAVIKHHGRLYEAKIKVESAEESPRPAGGTFHALRQRREEIDKALILLQKRRTSPAGQRPPRGGVPGLRPGVGLPGHGAAGAQ